MKTSPTPRLLALTLVGAFALAACGGSDSGSSADPCDAAQKVSEAFEVGDSAETDEEISEALDSFVDALENLAKAAPDEIKSDVELLAEGTRALSEIEPGTAPTQEQQELLESEEFDRAGDRLDEYFEESCDLEF